VDALLTVNLVILALVLFLVFGLLRSHAAILRRLHELEGKEPGPAPVRLADPSAAARYAKPRSADTETRDGVTLPARTRMVIVAKDLSEESPSELAKLAPRGVDLVCSSKAWSDYEVPGSPYVIAVEGATGRIQGEGTGMSWEQVAGLLAQATGDRTYVVGDAARNVAKPIGDVEREARVDQELLSAGILPGDPSLFPDQGPTP